MNNPEITAKITLAHQAFLSWSKTPLIKRTKLLRAVAKTLLAQKSELAVLMAQEMGKLKKDGIAEIEKCATVCNYYADNASDFLQPTIVKTEATTSYIRYDPLGVTLAIMPWNFPFWQVFRAAAPALVAGNTLILKHASSVPQCAHKIESIFTQAGATAGIFQTVLLPGSHVASIISHPFIRKIALTGSEEAGISAAVTAAKNLKPTILELGGSDAFVVFADADLKAAVAAATTSRLIVSGQSCIAAKRFIIHESIYAQFIDEFVRILKTKKIGDPTDPSSDIGPLVNTEAVVHLHSQVSASIKMGAKVLLGGVPSSVGPTYYPPTILTEVTPDMPVFVEETFGPVAAVTTFNAIDEAIQLANHPHFGLGLSVWTKNQDIIETMVSSSETGCVFVNAFVKSDPRLPFGGTKNSGYGRELGVEGLREYTNIKTVWVN